ncbi:hypothetical protein F9B85_10585 [Heliorestis acidaminivorans]|uniref:Uncharacterized protein n=2 Tax=Heliorestis TaxID=79598 RepID=A0A6I0F0W6_9FIRM|nr:MULTISPECIES: hypothetical protein [Heliorestis]KAB2951994.1 hypothetical protein F9B85_10585 [Heliorestis acidaminivorans]QGG46350.1 hypothetical protein FTV88_0171 [Heliorestis convoluta]
MSNLKAWFKDKVGGPSIETVAIIVFVVLVLFGGLRFLGSTLSDTLQGTAEAIQEHAESGLSVGSDL